MWLTVNGLLVWSRVLERLVFDVVESDEKAATSRVYGDWKRGTFTSNNILGTLDIECRDGH